MKPSEAVELCTILRAAFPSIRDDQEKIYARLLEAEPDALAASKAILDGIKVWKFTPSYAQIREAIRMEKDRMRLAEPHPPEPKRDIDLGFWVRKWICARFLYATFHREKDTRPFAEQFPHGPPPDIELMPENEWASEANEVDIADAWRAVRANTGGEA